MPGVARSRTVSSTMCHNSSHKTPRFGGFGVSFPSQDRPPEKKVPRGLRFKSTRRSHPRNICRTSARGLGIFLKIERPGVCTTCWANRWVPFAEGGCLPFRSLIRSGSAVVLHCFRNGSALLPQWFFTASAVIRAFCKSSRIAVEKKRNVR